MVEHTAVRLNSRTLWQAIVYGTFVQLLNYLGNVSLLGHIACFSTTCTGAALASTCGDQPYWKPNVSTRSFFTAIMLFPALSTVMLDKEWNTHVYDCLTVFAYNILVWCTQTPTGNEEDTPARPGKRSSFAQVKRHSTEQDGAFKLRIRRTAVVLVLSIQLATALVPDIWSFYNYNRCQVHEQQIDNYTRQIRASGWGCNLVAQSLTIDRVTRESLREADKKTCGVRCVEMCLCANGGKDWSAHLSIAPSGSTIDSAYCGFESQFDTCVLGPFQG